MFSTDLPDWQPNTTVKFYHRHQKLALGQTGDLGLQDVPGAQRSPLEDKDEVHGLHDQGQESESTMWLIITNHCQMHPEPMKK